MSQPCGCCEGLEAITPVPIANRPGLNALTYRVGTHATFLETMQAMLSSSGYPGLKRLKTRESNDPAIAFLDAWATVADVLTFYQERIANEGYLRTATERRSVLELAQLVGYTLRPGVASSVYLAFTLEPTATDDTLIPVGTRAQSLPGPGELPQSFETFENLKARIRWNQIKPRQTIPQKIQILQSTGQPSTIDTDTIYLKGIATNLKPNDPLLFVFKDEGDGQVLRHVKSVEMQTEFNRTKVILQEKPPSPTGESDRLMALSMQIRDEQTEEDRSPFGRLANTPEKLALPPSLQPANPLRLSRNLAQTFINTSDTFPHLLTALQPALRSTLYQALDNLDVTKKPTLKVFALRTRASVFGHNAQPIPILSDGNIVGYRDWALKPPTTPPPPPSLAPMATTGRLQTPLEGTNEEDPKIVWLDTTYEKVLPNDSTINNSWVVLKRPGSEPVISKVKSVNDLSRSDYGLSTKSTRIELQPDPANLVWINLSNDTFDVIRKTAVYAQSEKLELAEQPILAGVGAVAGVGADPTRIVLDGSYDGLEAGRWIIVSGDRADVEGVRSSELVMLAGVIQDYDKDLPGDKTHTTLILANEGLAYPYKRDTVTIYANVVKATHGETRTEVLGSGDGSKPFQQFALHQKPLTYLPAPTATGINSTLQVRVNDILWHEVDSLAGLNPTDRNFTTRTDNDGKTSIIFGNGINAARLPTGVENVNAVYRNGIGKVGNIGEKKISLLATRPLGVKSVINPLAATGGADPESRDQARRNTPLAVMSLDRLVSVQDYADFTRTFAGIGKASAQLLSNGQNQLVHLTIAGADDIPISTQSELYRNLLEALQKLGNPHQPFKVEVRELILILLNAQVQILPDYKWEVVVTQIRSTLLETFSFDRHNLGQTVFLSEVISTIQQVPGVAYVDVNVFGGLPDKTIDGKPLTPTQIIQIVQAITKQTTKDKGTGTTPDLKQKFSYTSTKLLEALEKGFIPVNLATQNGVIRPAQIAYLNPNLPDSLILTELKP